MESDDYYQILKISRKANLLEIKRAYRKAVLVNHPDLHPGDGIREEKMKMINEAYSILSNPEKRTKYDMESFVSRSLDINPFKTPTYLFMTWARFWLRCAQEVNKLLL